MSSPVSYDLQGQGGGIVINVASGTVSGNFRWVQVITDASFSEIDSSGQAGTIGGISRLWSPVVIPAGVGIGGRFTNITVASGVVIAYYA